MPHSVDPAALRAPLIAEQIAVVYRLIGEQENTRLWLTTAYDISRAQLDSQVQYAYDTCAEMAEHPKFDHRTDNALDLEVNRANPTSGQRVPAIRPRAYRSLGPNVHRMSGTPGEPWQTIGVTIGRDPDFEARLIALAELDAEAQLLRATCIQAGLGATELRAESPRQGARRALFRGGSRESILLVLDALNYASVFAKTGPPAVGRPLRKRYLSLPWTQAIDELSNDYDD